MRRIHRAIWWALIIRMQCSGDTSGEDRIRTDDLLTAKLTYLRGLEIA